MDSAGKRGVCFFNLGTKHVARLAVALWSLRKVYDGPIAILHGNDDGKQICGELSTASGAVAVEVPVVQRRRHTAYCMKSSLWRHSIFDTTLLSDSDVVYLTDPTPLLDLAAKEPHLVVSRFADWHTGKPLIQKRIQPWAAVKCEGIDTKQLVRDSLESPRAAINTGLIAWSTAAEPFLEDWERLTAAGAKLPLTDEIAAQCLLRAHDHTLVSTAWNFSPLYSCGEPKIVHHHGRKELRSEAIGYWLPPFMEAWNSNFASIQAWMPDADRQRLTENGVIL